MKQIPLTQGKVAFIDDEDFERISMHKWHARKAMENRFYASTTKNLARFNGKQKQKRIQMSRFILDVPDDGEIIVDHKNHDTLDNQKHNLRICSRKDNQRNSLRAKNNKSGYKGVWWDKNLHQWRATITFGGHMHYLGISKDRVVCAMLYDDAARKFYGEFAFTNFPEKS